MKQQSTIKNISDPAATLHAAASQLPCAAFAGSVSKRMKAILLIRQKRYIVDAPPTGFKSTDSINKATLFADDKAARAFMSERGIFTADIIEFSVKEIFKQTVSAYFEYCPTSQTDAERKSRAMRVAHKALIKAGYSTKAIETLRDKALMTVNGLRGLDESIEVFNTEINCNLNQNWI